MSSVEYELENTLAIIRLNRPHVRNAIDNEVVSLIDSYLDRALDDNARAVVIIGNGSGFCAGTDLKEMQAMTLAEYLRKVDRVHALFQRLRDFPLLSIAAVHGPALGGGTELAAACTFRIASEQALFGLPEVKLGVMPSYGGTQLLSRLIGENQALELMLSARQLSAEEALAIGLINRVCSNNDSLLVDACDYAKSLSQYSLVAQQGIRACSAVAFEGSLDEGLQFERKLTASVFASADAKEGVAAFLEKRDPVFSDC